MWPIPNKEQQNTFPANPRVSMQVDGDDPVVLVPEISTIAKDSLLERKASLTNQLIRLGSVLLHTYADPATDYDIFQPKLPPVVENPEETTGESNVVSAVAKLNKAVQRAFGAVGDYLKYDYSEEFGPLRTKCL